MRSILVKKEEEVKITFCYGFTKDGNSVVAETTKENLLDIWEKALDITTIREHTAFFKRPCYGDLVDIAGSISTTGENFITIKPLEIRLNRMSELLKSWDLTDQANEDAPIPATKESVYQLEPAIANIIGLQLDALIGTV